MGYFVPKFINNTRYLKEFLKKKDSELITKRKKLSFINALPSSKSLEFNIVFELMYASSNTKLNKFPDDKINLDNKSFQLNTFKHKYKTPESKKYAITLVSIKYIICFTILVPLFLNTLFF